MAWAKQAIQHVRPSRAHVARQLWVADGCVAIEAKMMTTYRLGWGLIGIGACLGIATGWGLYLWMTTHSAASSSTQVSSHPIVVAARDLGRGATLRPEDGRVVQFPDSTRPHDALTTLDELEGRIVLDPLRQDEPLLRSKLAPTDLSSSPLSLRTAVSKRGYPLRLDSLTTGLLSPGDRIDLVVTTKPTDGPDLAAEETATVAVQNLLVLDVLGSPPARSDRSASSPDVSEGTTVPTGVVLEVTPEEAERVALAEQQGTVRAIVRNPIDSATASPPGVTRPALLGMSPRPAGVSRDLRVGPPAEMQPPEIMATRPMEKTGTRIEVIRGGIRSEVVF